MGATGGLNTKPAHELIPLIRNGEVTAQAVCESVFSAIAQQDPDINAYITLDEENALEQAADVDRRIALGENVGPLAGIPVALKDLICTKNLLTTCGSKILPISYRLTTPPSPLA